MNERLRRKRLWNVKDFAEHMGISRKQARVLLKALHRESGNMLLRATGGRKPEYTFFPTVLAKVKPEIFESIESLEGRVDDALDRVTDLEGAARLIVKRVSQNSRDIMRLLGQRNAA